MDAQWKSVHCGSVPDQEPAPAPQRKLVIEASVADYSVLCEETAQNEMLCVCMQWKSVHCGYVPDQEPAPPRIGAGHQDLCS